MTIQISTGELDDKTAEVQEFDCNWADTSSDAEFSSNKTLMRLAINWRFSEEDFEFAKRAKMISKSKINPIKATNKLSDELRLFTEW